MKSPKLCPKFTAHWVRLVGDFHGQNISEALKGLLIILCDLYVQYDEVSAILADCGLTYEAEGRYGLTIRTRPEVTMRQMIQRDIRAASKQLGVYLKSKGETEATPDPEWLVDDDL